MTPLLEAVSQRSQRRSLPHSSSVTALQSPPPTSPPLCNLPQALPLLDTQFLQALAPSLPTTKSRASSQVTSPVSLHTPALRPVTHSLSPSALDSASSHLH